MNRIVKSALIAGLSALTLGVGTARAEGVHETAPVARQVSGNPQRLPPQHQQGGYGQPQRGAYEPRPGYGQPQVAGYDRGRDDRGEHRQDRDAYNDRQAAWNAEQAAWNTPVFVSWTPESYRRADRELDRQQDLFFARHEGREQRERFAHRMSERRAELRRRYEEQCREHGQRAVYYRG